MRCTCSSLALTFYVRYVILWGSYTMLHAFEWTLHAWCLGFRLFWFVHAESIPPKEYFTSSVFWDILSQSVMTMAYTKKDVLSKWEASLDTASGELLSTFLGNPSWPYPLHCEYTLIKVLKITGTVDFCLSVCWFCIEMLDEIAAC